MNMLFSPRMSAAKCGILSKQGLPSTKFAGDSSTCRDTTRTVVTAQQHTLDPCAIQAPLDTACAYPVADDATVETPCLDGPRLAVKVCHMHPDDRGLLEPVLGHLPAASSGRAGRGRGTAGQPARPV
jgi:hypothetical protein